MIEYSIGSTRTWLARRTFSIGYLAIVVLILGTIIAVAVAARPSLGSAKSVAFVAIAISGALMILRQFAVRWEKAAIRELINTVGVRDPGDSPVSWISDETWRRAERWNPEYEFHFPGPHEPRPCVSEPEPVEVNESDKQRAPIVSVDSTPAQEIETNLEALNDAPNANILWIHCPAWPVCCSCLTTIVGVGDVDEAFKEILPKAHFLEHTVGSPNPAESASQPHGDEYLAEGAALFHCRKCSRVYLSSYHP